MAFELRTAVAKKLIDILQDHVFAPCSLGLKVVPFGYETHIQSGQLNELTFVA